VDDEVIGLAVTAGLVAGLNPCGFAMLPAYLGLVVRGDARRGALVAFGRAVGATVAMAFGFVVVFGTFGLLTIAAASTVQRYLPYATVLIGIVFVVLGCWLLIGRELTLLARLPHGRWAPTARISSMFGYGLSYAVASLSCTIGPFLAATGSAVRSGSATDVALVYLGYTAGFTLVVGSLAVAAAVASAAIVERMRRIVPYVNRFSGALLAIVGLYVTYYGFYEIRLFTGNGNPADPVITAAGRLQGTVAGWVHRHGVWPWLIVIAVLLGVVLLLARRAVASGAARRRRADPARAGDGPSPAPPEKRTRVRR
jgi:cytochrome c biogenesis protein CcdA